MEVNAPNFSFLKKSGTKSHDPVQALRRRKVAGSIATSVVLGDNRRVRPLQRLP
jgi:hypothetical protein